MSDAPMETQFVVIIATCSKDEEAKALANALIDRRLAACVQTHPISSTYRWDGNIQCDDEIRVIIKTVDLHFEKIVSTIQEFVPYENPQVVCLPIQRGTLPYLGWVLEMTSSEFDAS